LLLDQIAAVTVSASNQSSAAYGGSAQVTFVTPSGTNDYHGHVYFWNRPSALAANTWFNNQSRTPKPFLNQNQIGGSAGGKILPNKLFFYTAYEAVRQRQQTSQNATVLSADARNGLFTYRDTGGTVRKVDVLQAAGIQQDPVTQALLAKVPAPDKINNFNVGDSSAALLRNTAGYSFLKRNNRTRDYVTGKIDYALSTKQSFALTALWNRDLSNAPDQDTTFNVIPSLRDDRTGKLLSTVWRWSPKANLTNEARFGFYKVPRITRATQDIPNFFVTGTLYTNPVLTVRTSGRKTDNYDFADNANYLLGSHNLQFGFQNQRVFQDGPFNDTGITPTYTLGIGTGNPGLTTQQLPGISANDLNAANNLLATLAGYYMGYSQTFYAPSRTSGFVSGASRVPHYTFANYALYLQDTWRVLRRLTANIGVRWDYLTVVDERNSLVLSPVVQNSDPIQTLLSNSTLDFVGKSVGRPWYNSDKNNFAPNVGLAWDVLGNGKTLLRAGYSIAFVNDNMIGAATQQETTNTGLGSTASVTTGLSGRVGSGLVAIPAPSYKVPRTFADNPTGSISLMDPNVVMPYLQQWNIALQQAIKGVILEVRYAGNHGTKEVRGYDANQVLIDAILPDFLKAQNNGLLSQRAGLGFDPRYNANIAGSQPLPFFAQLPGGGNLNNAANSGQIMRGEVGELASSYQASGTNGPVNFFRNPYGPVMNLTTNLSDSTYNALQVQGTYRFVRGLQIQANYTYSKTLSNTNGNAGNAFYPGLDNNNRGIDRSRAAFMDLTHVFKATGSYDLPLDHASGSHSVVKRVLEGWNIAAVFNAQTGQPFSILSGRGTLNRFSANRSINNTVNTTLNKAQLDDLIGFRMTPSGPYFVAASAIGPDGRGTAADGTAPFAGQVFFNPPAGTVGTIQRNWFSAPSIWTLDTKISKTTRIAETQSIELRLDASNVFNHPNFVIGDQNINSTTFGKITSTVGRLSTESRQLQLSLSYRF
jgi:hypothetical protein